MTDELTRLCKEKKATMPKVEKPKKAPKKIKKKDIEILPIEERELCFYEFDLIRDIKIYNGILIDNKETILNNIEFYKAISAYDKFTELQPSTLTARGSFSNTAFNEEDFIKVLNVPPIKYCSILKIGSNFGEIYHYPNPFINHPINAMVKSISILKGENIKIGCNCQALLDISSILILIESIISNEVPFNKLFKKYIKIKISLDKYFNKKKAVKIIKNFGNLQNFIYNDEDSIRELYNVIEIFIPKEFVQLCNTYIDNVVNVVKVFTDYEKLCTCSKQFSEENDLMHLNKNALIKIKKNAVNKKEKEADDKIKTKRKIQGTGLYFSSQISFEMYNYHNDKITKIKIFRNGNYQVPGVKEPDMSDLVDSVILLKDYLNYVSFENGQVKEINSHKVEIPYMISVMRNYKCLLSDSNITIILNKLEDIFDSEKSLKMHNLPLNEYLQFVHKITKSEKMVHRIFRYCNFGFYQISEISLNSERYPGLLVKFLRPIPGKDTKKLTIKILSSGKINLDGCTSQLEVIEIYHWIQYIFIKYWSEITYDEAQRIDEVNSSDTESEYESIYDSV